MLAPIILFVYNRPIHTQRLLESLANNDWANLSKLYIYCDGPKDPNNTALLFQINEVRNIANNVCGFSSVTVKQSDINLGLANSVIKGVSEVLEEHQSVIVLEDDLQLSPMFLKYMNNALSHYADEDQVMHISGYWYPIKSVLPHTFFLTLAPSWGWGTWKRAWVHFQPSAVTLLEQFQDKDLIKKFDYNYTFNFLRMLKSCVAKTNDSWAIRWYASLFLRKGLCLLPRQSYVNNFGHDNSGIHSQSTDVFENPTLSIDPFVDAGEIVENIKARKLLIRFFIIAKFKMLPILFKDKFSQLFLPILKRG